MTPEQQRKLEITQAYEAAAHAMQSAVAYELTSRGTHGAAASAKHLRVGINAAMSDAGGLAGLLIKKGIFTEEEYFIAITKAMEKEVERYENLLRVKPGTFI